MKIKFMALALLAVLYTGCAEQANPNPVPGTTSNQSNSQSQYQTQIVDQGKLPGELPIEESYDGEKKGENKPKVNENGKTQKTTIDDDDPTASSTVNNIADFQKAITENGTWLVTTTKNLSTDKELILEGKFDKRQIALNNQDNLGTITDKFTLSFPKLTINNPNTTIQHGTLKGDLYVSAKNLQLVDTTVDGNIYFTNDEAKSTFKMDNKSKVTGKQEVKK